MLRFVFYFTLLAAIGCGAEVRSKGDADLAGQALTLSLNSWKRGEPMERLANSAEPIHFEDEQRPSAHLADFTVGKPEEISAGIFRVPVKLKIKTSGELDVVYRVELDSPIRITRES